MYLVFIQFRNEDERSHCFLNSKYFFSKHLHFVETAFDGFSGIAVWNISGAWSQRRRRGNLKHHNGSGLFELLTMLSANIMLQGDIKGNELSKVYLLKESFALLMSWQFFLVKRTQLLFKHCFNGRSESLNDSFFQTSPHCQLVVNSFINVSRGFSICFAHFGVELVVYFDQRSKR